MAKAFLRNQRNVEVQSVRANVTGRQIRQRSSMLMAAIQHMRISNALLLPCLAAAGVMVAGQHTAMAVPSQWQLSGSLDSNATVNGGLVTVSDLASNNAANGMNLSSFTTALSTAYTNNLGGVFNFEAYSSSNPSYPTSEITQVVIGTTTGNGPGGATPNDVQGFLANSATFNAGSGIGTVASGSVASGTPLVSFYRNFTTGNTIAPGSNAYAASGPAAATNAGGGTIAFSGSTAFTLTFEPAAGYGVSSFGITDLSRGNNSANTGTMTASFSGGGTAVSSAAVLSGAANTADFIGFNAPSGQTITSVSWTLASGGIGRFDDAAFIMSALAAGTSFYYAGGATGNFSGANWSTNASGSPTTTLPATGAEVVFAASSVTATTITANVDTAQNLFGITINPSNSVTIGGTQSLTLGSGGYNASSATGTQVISTSGGLIVANAQSWTVNNALTVSSKISGSAPITLNGTGTTVLSASNSYTGTAIVTSGILQLANPLALGSATVQVNGGLFDLNGSATLGTLNSTTAAAGGTVTSTSASPATLTIAGVDTVGYGGAINESAGQISVVVNPGANLILADNTVSNYTGGTTVSPGATLNIGVQVNGYANITDRTIGTGPLTLGSATGTTSTVVFGTQAGGGAATHTFTNGLNVLGNTLIKNAEGVNKITGPVVLNGSNNTLTNDFIDKPFLLAGPISGSGSLFATGYGTTGNATYGGGGYLGIGNATAAVDNTGFTGTITADNVVTTDHNKGLQIVAYQNAVLPNGVLAFTADLPVAGVGPSGTSNGFVGSAVSFIAAVTAPQIGALSSSNGGGIALVTQGSSSTSFGSGVNLTLGLNNTTVNSYNGSLYDDPTAPGSLTKAGTNIQVLTGSNSYIGGTNVAGGTLSFASPKAFPNFTSLNIGISATAAAANFGTGSKNNLFTSSLTIAGATGAWTGVLDLANNDMVVQNGSVTTLTNQVAQGFNGGKWNGSGGIVSTAAAADTTHLHAIGVIQNSADGTPTGTELYSSATSNAFDGATADADTDVLLKYTYFGDTNLDGKIDGSDYSRIDSAKTTGATGWYNGDFNYDGVINGSDYTLIDNAFNLQGAQILSQLATSTAEVAGGGSVVPEPASLGILGIGLVSLSSRRRRLASK